MAHALLPFLSKTPSDELVKGVCMDPPVGTIQYLGKLAYKTLLC